MTARRRALDMHRRAATAQRALPKLFDPEEYADDEPGRDSEDIGDDRLRLIFTCCHPALALDAQVALTLRLLCGLSTAPSADLMRRDLAERGLELARMLRVLLPFGRGLAGLLALVVLTDARRGARLDEHRELVLMENQDRSKWDRRAIEEGLVLLREALNSRPPGRFALMAAIAAVHDESRVAFEEALTLSENDAERRYLRTRLNELAG